MTDHDILPALIALRFYLEAPNLSIAVLCLKSDPYRNWWGDFLALGLFTVTNLLGNIGLFPVNNSVVETIAAPRIALYCF